MASVRRAKTTAASNSGSFAAKTSSAPGPSAGLAVPSVPPSPIAAVQTSVDRQEERQEERQEQREEPGLLDRWRQRRRAVAAERARQDRLYDLTPDRQRRSGGLTYAGQIATLNSLVHFEAVETRQHDSSTHPKRLFELHEALVRYPNVMDEEGFACLQRAKDLIEESRQIEWAVRELVRENQAAFTESPNQKLSPFGSYFQDRKSHWIARARPDGLTYDTVTDPYLRERIAPLVVELRTLATQNIEAFKAECKRADDLADLISQEANLNATNRELLDSRAAQILADVRRNRIENMPTAADLADADLTIEATGMALKEFRAEHGALFETDRIDSDLLG